MGTKPPRSAWKQVALRAAYKQAVRKRVTLEAKLEDAQREEEELRLQLAEAGIYHP